MIYHNKNDLEDYQRNHSACPKCGKTGLERTAAGQIMHPGVTIHDSNKAKCKCGWAGQVHDMVPAK